ncbi:TetR/AcrR family transcriptional regulator [Bacillus sp. DJP31]|uniref:TetR/AcrR family transcriptional regulator n=1 Tax=Bacillus sp. DJP31 TaxID=3409789 RepID=UPI003BB78225
MKEKDLIIIEEAIKLFAKKGFSATSIQEIATESRISKGAFYLHFKSKEALLLAILHYYFDSLQKNVLSIEDEGLPPRARFTKQINVMFENLLQHKEFIIMQSREQAIPLNEEVKELIYKMQLSTHEFYRNNIVEIYGNEVEKYVWDLSIILEGIFHSYMKLLFLGQQAVDMSRIAQYMLNRLDDLVNSLVNGEEKPLITHETIQTILENSNMCMLLESDNISAVLLEMRSELANSNDNEDLLVSLEVVEAEIKQEIPRAAVLQGMLSNFKKEPKFEKYITRITKLYNLQN